MTPRALGWAKRLPFFALALLVSLINSIGMSLFLDHPGLLTFEKINGMVYAILRVGAYLEALRWLFQTVPGLRVGWLIFGAGTFAGVGIQFAMAPMGAYLEAYRIPALIERSTGFGVFVALMIGVAFYDLLDGFCSSARWHSITVALWAILDAAGWAVIQNGLPYHGSALIIAGAICCPLLWLWKVSKAPPAWGASAPADPAEAAALRKIADEARRFEDES